MSDILEVYHSGIETVDKPDIFHSRPNLDFGPGFYLTDIYEQAVTWALKRAENKNGQPVLNKYLLHQRELLNEIKGKSMIFEEYDEKWFDFVISNRLGQELWKPYHYVEGGVADDRVITTIELYMSGYYTRTEALARLKYLKPNNQICISRQDLIDRYLHFTESIIIEKL